MRKKQTFLLCFILLLSVVSIAGCSSVVKTNKTEVTLLVSKLHGEDGIEESVEEGLSRLERDLDIEKEVIKCSDKEFTKKLNKAADKSNFVVIVGFEEEKAIDIAELCPDTVFIFVDSNIKDIDKFKNALCIKYARHECAFLAGFLAAHLSQKQTVGVDANLGGNYISGFEQGAHYADPDLKIIKDVNQDVFFNASGTVIKNDSSVCSVKIDAGMSVYDVIKFALEDEMQCGAIVWEADMSSGYLSLEYMVDETAVSSDLKSEIERVSAKIISGEIKVETAE